VFFSSRVIVKCNSKLFEIVQALRAPGRFSGALYRRQQEGNKHTDDCNYDQQFDDRES
jgi:hypothetical protein